MKRPKIAGWEVTINENNVQMATLNSERLIETLKYIEYLESRVENLDIQRVSNNEVAVCRHCGKTKGEHSVATHLCPDTFKHFEAN